ncbi:unnamed protein product [Blumeria hordei]|uniref:Transcription factor n=2 Tax=Blumeria hordei TaxID=2867405 RepID=A0A383UVS4_BLUHO|nr:unnamed protein product [Blumeria hordei]
MEKEKSLDMGGQPNNSSDFVRKLFKMLEDPTYSEIVRWADGGETFVVLENEKFTKMVLPKHFKHSNFASFVRQLNKYDFHKVRQNNDDSASSPYGPNAWEFKHPEFQEHKKDLLDNIKRKAPATRKPNPAIEEQLTSQQIDHLNNQLAASQQQVQQLTERCNELAQGHINLLQQVVQLQNFVRNHERVMQKVMGFLHSVDAQRRNSRLTFRAGMGGGEMPNDSNIDDHVASPLQQATELLGQFSAENLPNKELKQMTNNYNPQNDYTTHSNNQPNAPLSLQTDNHNMGYHVSNDLDSSVYPVGNTNGINPIHSEHIHNIPYAPPANILLQTSMQSEIIPENSPSTKPKKTTVKPLWTDGKPSILLVEDDKVCARIGTKFLQSFDCAVDTAQDGLEAVNKVNTDQFAFDLILMDIIMPRLDGVSASVCIKELRPNIPIIAMTSNIRADDIEMYFSHGMNGVLPKPFTKEGMLRALEKHLPESKDAAIFQPSVAAQLPPDFTPTPSSHQVHNLNMPHSTNSLLKHESSKKTTPPTAAWNSNNQLPVNPPVGASPSGYLQQSIGESQTFNMTSNMNQVPSGFNSSQQNQTSGVQRLPQRRVYTDLSNSQPDGPSEKRQRMFPLQPGAFAQ